MTFETKGGTERMQFDSGMVRDTATGKTMWDLTADGPMLKRWAELLTRGAVGDPNATPPTKGYGARNWMKASGDPELARFKESAFRHFMQWYRDERDEDHGAAVFFNINGAEYVKEKKEKIPPTGVRVWKSRKPQEDDTLKVGEWLVFGDGSGRYVIGTDPDDKPPTPLHRTDPPRTSKTDWISRYSAEEGTIWYKE